MAGVYRVLYSQDFTSTDTIVVNHSLGFGDWELRILVDGAVQNDLVESVSPDPGDPLNTVTVNLTTSSSGRIQLVSSDTTPSSYLSPEVVAALVSTGGGPAPLSSVLEVGDFTGGNNIVISNGDGIIGAGGASFFIFAGSNTANFGTGGALTISGGAGGAGGIAGDVTISTFGLPAEPGDIQLNSAGAVLINPATDSTAQVNGSSVLQFNERSSLAGPPAITAGQGRVWVRNDSPNVLVFTDDTATDWELNGPLSVETLAQTLSAGNSTGGTNFVLTSGDEIQGQPGVSSAGPLYLRGATASSGTSAGGNVFVLGGGPLGSGQDGGAVTISGGDADSVSGEGGDVTISGGDSAGAGNDGGSVNLVGGNATIFNAQGGDINLTPGTNVSGPPGVVRVNGLKNYGARTANPTNPSPSAGDRYYNTNLEMEMVYDGTRSKWLSVETATFGFGRLGNTAAGSFYRMYNGVISSASLGYHAMFNGTVVGLAYTRSTATSSTFEITSNGTNIATLASAATTGRSTSLNANFNQGVTLAARNAAGGNTTADVTVWVRVKWRA